MIYLLLASFLWGTSFIAGKFAYETLDPALVVLFRLIIAGVILFPITLRFIKKNSKSDVDWKKFAFTQPHSYCNLLVCNIRQLQVQPL